MTTLPRRASCSPTAPELTTTGVQTAAMKRSREQRFPEEDSIPEQYRVSQPVNQNYFLINGELRAWDGPLQDVISPVYVNEGETSARKLVGRVPLLDETAALEALSVAVRAYDNGRGSWPTMSVGERIQCVQRFTRDILKKRSKIVCFLMWEIGKSLQEAENEFARAISYI